MIFYTAVGNRVEEDSGRFVVRVGEQEKVLSEMETMIWAALTWSVFVSEMMGDLNQNKGWQQLYENLEKIQIGYERIPGFFRNGL